MGRDGRRGARADRPGGPGGVPGPVRQAGRADGGEALHRPSAPVRDRDGQSDSDEDVAAAVAGLGPFTTPAEVRRTRAKVLGSTGAGVPFYDLTFSATKSSSLLQASYAAAAAKARARRATRRPAAEYERRVRAIDEAAVETARQVVALAERRALFVRTGHHSAHSGECRDAAGRWRRCSRSMTTAAANPTCTCTSCCSTGRCAPTMRSGDGKWRALYGRPLWKEQLGLAADAERIFARLLALQGIPLVQQENGNAFEVGGVEQATMDAFSQRTRGQIDPKAAAEAAEYERLYGRPPSARTLWEWRQHIARSTRKAKPADPPTGARAAGRMGGAFARRGRADPVRPAHTRSPGTRPCHAPPAELIPGAG